MAIRILLLVLTVSRLSGTVPDQTAESQVGRLLTAAQEADRLKDYDTARRQYEMILKLRPKQPLIRQSVAITYHLQNRFAEAIAQFQLALRMDPTLWGSDLFLGMDYYKSNQFTQAIAPLKASIALNPKMAEPEARFWLGVTYSALDKHEDAIRELRRDLELRPNDLDLLYYFAKACDTAASATYERLGRIDPLAAAVSLLQAERLVEENRSDLAAAQYRVALRLRPDYAGWISELPIESKNSDEGDITISAWDAKLTLALADLLAGVGETQQTAEILHNLANQEGADTKATGLIARASAKPLSAPPDRLNGLPEAKEGLQLLSQRQFQQALAPLVRAAEKNDNLYLRLALVRAQTETGEYLTAEKHLAELLRAEPGAADALYLLGRNYKYQAEAALQRMMAMDGDSYGVHELLGRQHEERTEFDLAIKEYQLALAKRPDLGGIRYALGNVYRKMSNYDQAEHWLLEEVQRNPYHGLAHYRLGSIYVERGKPEDAISQLELAVRAHPELVDARLDLGRAYTAAARYEDAIKALKRVAAEEPGNDRVHYLLSTAFAKDGQRDQARIELEAYQRLTRERLQHTQRDVKDATRSLEQR